MQRQAFSADSVPDSFLSQLASHQHFSPTTEIILHIDNGVLPAAVGSPHGCLPSPPPHTHHHHPPTHHHHPHTPLHPHMSPSPGRSCQHPQPPTYVHSVHSTPFLQVLSTPTPTTTHICTFGALHPLLAGPVNTHNHPHMYIRCTPPPSCRCCQHPQPPTYVHSVHSTPFLQVLSKRLQHLASAGLLQREKPECSQLMVTASNTLPDQLLTIIQVMMGETSRGENLLKAPMQQGLLHQCDRVQDSMDGHASICTGETVQAYSGHESNLLSA